MFLLYMQFELLIIFFLRNIKLQNISIIFYFYSICSSIRLVLLLFPILFFCCWHCFLIPGIFGRCFPQKQRKNKIWEKTFIIKVLFFIAIFTRTGRLAISPFSEGQSVFDRKDKIY